MDKKLKTAAMVLLPVLVILVAALFYYPPFGGNGETPNTAVLIDYSADKTNINTAPVAELTALPGIGQAKATAIVEYREMHGAFLDVKDLLNVAGIGPKILEDLLEYVTIE